METTNTEQKQKVSKITQKRKDNLFKALERIKAQAHNRLREGVISYILDYHRTDEEIRGFFNDLLHGGCSSGMIGHLIYFKDTNHFYDKFEEEIEELISSNMDEQGIKSRLLFIAGLNDSVESITQEKNLLAWFGFEETAYQLYNELDLDN